MMKKLTNTLLSLGMPLLLNAPFALAEIDPFYANAKVQSQAPKAFVLQPQSLKFVRQAMRITQEEANSLTMAIVKDDEIEAMLESWPTLSFDEMLPYLVDIFELQCRLVGIGEPKLIIDSHSYPGKTVYFDFDPDNPDRGTVFLNSEKLAQMDNWTVLALMIHETRHSLQFQLAFDDNGIMASTYRAAFEAQKQLTDYSFSDFMTLANEYEAFQFANQVVGRLSHWQWDMESMGSYVSQFHPDGKLKVDLIKLHNQDKGQSLLDKFNHAVKPQWQNRQQHQTP